jgi:hypothetical protein
MKTGDRMRFTLMPNGVVVTPMLGVDIDVLIRYLIRDDGPRHERRGGWSIAR